MGTQDQKPNQQSQSNPGNKGAKDQPDAGKGSTRQPTDKTTGGHKS